MLQPRSKVSRRRFMQAGAAAMVAPTVVPSWAQGRTGIQLPSEREDGWVFVDRGKLKASDPRWTEADFSPGPRQVYVSDNPMRNFLDCVRSRRECIAPAETAHRSITPGHLAYVSQALGRRLKWDAENELVTGDDEANALLQTHDYRKPWKLI